VNLTFTSNERNKGHRLPLSYRACYYHRVIGHEEIWDRTFGVLQKLFYEYHDRLVYDRRREEVSCITEECEATCGSKICQ